MKVEWPVLLKIMGKGEGEDRYLSVAEVRTLFIERKFPDRITQRVVSQPVTRPRCVLRVAGGLVAALLVFGIVALRFPDQFQPMLPGVLGELVAAATCRACRTPGRVLARAELVDWRTGTGFIMPARAPRPSRCPMPGSWRWSSRGFISSPSPACCTTATISQRFGFIPSPQTINTDEATLRRFGYANVYDKTKPVPARLWDPACNRCARPRISTACRSALRA